MRGLAQETMSDLFHFSAEFGFAQTEFVGVERVEAYTVQVELISGFLTSPIIFIYEVIPGTAGEGCSASKVRV